jgi:hypothetical protein
VAGTGVLGTAFAARGFYPVAAVLLGLASVSWLALTVSLFVLAVSSVAVGR